jgi:hypothetical protein
MWDTRCVREEEEITRERGRRTQNCNLEQTVTQVEEVNEGKKSLSGIEACCAQDQFE